jgi:hypothetical protein
LGDAHLEQQAVVPGQAINPWEYGVSEQPLTDRFLQQRRLTVICHPIKGELAITAARPSTVV